jgi:alpha-1,6-mannosyltransferase
VDEVWRQAPSPYGPLWLALSAAAVRASGERLLPSLAGLRLLAVLGLLLAGWALHRLGGERALWLGTANPLVLLHLVAGAHNEALMLGLGLAGLAVAGRPRRPGPRRPAGALGRLAVAAALVALGALVKLPVALLLPFLVMAVPGGWAARLRAAAGVTAAAALTAVLVTAASGLGWGWLGTLGTGTARLSLLSATTGLGLLLPGGRAALEAAWAGGLLAGAGLAAALLWRTPRLGAPLSAGLALLVVALLLPVVQPWYVLWGVLPLAASAGPRLAAAVGALCLVLCLLVEPSGRHVVRPPLYGLPALAAAGAAVLVLRSGAERPAVRTRPAPQTTCKTSHILH